MAIKYGRPLESRTRVVPIDPAGAGQAAASLDLTERPRRLRQADWIRRLVREHALSTADLIWPMFVAEGQKSRVPVASMPGVERLSVDEIVREAERAAKLTIPCIAL